MTWHTPVSYSLHRFHRQISALFFHYLRNKLVHGSQAPPGCCNPMGNVRWRYLLLRHAQTWGPSFHLKHYSVLSLLFKHQEHFPLRLGSRVAPIFSSGGLFFLMALSITDMYFWNGSILLTKSAVWFPAAEYSVQSDCAWGNINVFLGSTDYIPAWMQAST